MPTSASSRNQPPVGDAAVGGPASVYTFHADGRRARDHSPIRSSSAGPRFGCTIVCVSTRPVPRVAVGHVAHRRDLLVLQHVLAGRAGRRREQGDPGLARAEHERGPRGGVDRARIDRVRPALGIDHPQEVAQGGGMRSVPQGGVDEMRLHVDHRAARPERIGGRGRLRHRSFVDRVEAATVRGIDRAQRQRGGPAVVGVRRGVERERARELGQGPVDAVRRRGRAHHEATPRGTRRCATAAATRATTASRVRPRAARRRRRRRDDRPPAPRSACR